MSMMMKIALVFAGMTLFTQATVFAQTPASSVDTTSSTVSAVDSSRVRSPEFYRHYWPGSCVEAVRRTNDLYWRARPDTARFDLARDTMLTASTAVARECVSKFSVAQVKPEHLILLAQVYLALEDDSSAHVAIQRRLDTEVSKSVAIRARTFAEIIKTYLRVSPARLSDALATQRQLETLTSADAAVGKVVAYQTLAMYYLKIDDDSNAIAMSERLLAAGAQLSQHDRQEFASTLFGAYAAMAEIAGARTGTTEAAAPIIARARQDLGNLEPIAERLDALESTYQLYGDEGGRLTGDFWFQGAGDTTPVVRPTPGKISIISFQPVRSQIPAFRRLQERFGDSIELTFVLRTNGYFRDQGPLTPTEEAKILREYYIDELKLPGVLVISSASSQELPDGRLVKGKSENVLKYSGGGKGNPGTLILDRQGVIRRIFSGWPPWTERELEQAVEKIR